MIAQLAPISRGAMSTMQDDASRKARRNPVITAFMNELAYHCQGAEHAYTDLVMALSQRGRAGQRDLMQQRKAFLYVDAFLMQAALVARALWPPADVRDAEIAIVGGENAEIIAAIRQARGEQLRAALGSEVSLLENLTLWDYFAYQDARLEVWALTAQVEESAATEIRSLPASNDAIAPDVVRQLDPVAMTYTFLGEEFDLAAIAAILGWVQRAAIAWIDAQPESA
jgi:hypothetical protein